MAEAAGRNSGKQADAPAAPGGKIDDSELKAKRRVNRMVLAIAAAMVAAVGLGAYQVVTPDAFLAPFYAVIAIALVTTVVGVFLAATAGESKR